MHPGLYCFILFFFFVLFIEISHFITFIVDQIKFSNLLKNGYFLGLPKIRKVVLCVFSYFYYKLREELKDCVNRKIIVTQIRYMLSSTKTYNAFKQTYINTYIHIGNIKHSTHLSRQLSIKSDQV